MGLLKVLRAFLDGPTDPQYGLDLIKRAGVSAGSLYPILSHLEEDGWAESRWEQIDESAEGRRKRRYYTLTPIGQQGAVALLRETSQALAPPRAVLT
jgi:PadR family transcriptional regulator, regulatory protein PadR